MTQQAGITVPARSTILLGRITGMSQTVVDAQFGSFLNDGALAHINQWGVDSKLSLTFYAGFGRKLAEIFKRTDILRAAVRIATVIQGVYANENIERGQGFCPCQRKGEKNSIACRYIGDRDALRSLLF